MTCAKLYVCHSSGSSTETDTWRSDQRPSMAMSRCGLPTWTLEARLEVGQRSRNVRMPKQREAPQLVAQAEALMRRNGYQIGRAPPVVGGDGSRCLSRGSRLCRRPIATTPARTFVGRSMRSVNTMDSRRTSEAPWMSSADLRAVAPPKFRRCTGAEGTHVLSQFGLRMILRSTPRRSPSATSGIGIRCQVPNRLVARAAGTPSFR